MITFKEARTEDALEIVLRKEDLDELKLGGAPVLEALVDSIKRSPVAFTARDREGRIVSIFGVSESGGNLHPWMLSSDLVSKHGKQAIAKAREMARVLRDTGMPVFNFVSKEAVKNRRFIEAAGYTIQDTAGSPFDTFYLGTEDVR